MLINQRVKISGGDLIIISFPRSMAWEQMKDFTRQVELWLLDNGLGDVRITSINGGENPLSLTVLSPTDAFEEVVLGAKNG